MGTNKSCFTNI